MASTSYGKVSKEPVIKQTAKQTKMGDLGASKVKAAEDAAAAAAAANKLISANPLDKAELTAMLTKGLSTTYYISNKLKRIYNNINTHITDRAIVKTITNPQEGFLSDIDGAKINPFVLLTSNPDIFTTNPMEPININLLIHSLLDRIHTIYGVVPIIHSVMSTEIYKKKLVANLTNMFNYYYAIMQMPQQNIGQTELLTFIFYNFIDYIKASVRDFAERQETTIQATPIAKYLSKRLCYLCGREIDKFNLEHKDNIIHAVLFAGLVQRVSRKGGNVVCGKYSEAALHKLLTEYASACAECNAKKSERNYTEYDSKNEGFIINHNYTEDMTALNKHTQYEGFLHLSLLADIKNIVMYDLHNTVSGQKTPINVERYTLYCAFCFVNLFKNLPLPIVILMYHNVTIMSLVNLMKIQPDNYREVVNLSQIESGSELNETENVGNAAVAVTAATALPTTLPTAAATALPTTLPTAVPTVYDVYKSYSPELKAAIDNANSTAEEIIKIECTTSTPNSSPGAAAAAPADAAAPGGGGLHTRRHYKKIKKVKSKKQHNRRKHTTKRVSKIRKTHKKY